MAYAALFVTLLLAMTAGADQGDCAQPVSTGAAPSVTDCLSILRVAVGGTPCEPQCICAPKGELPTSALDALICLKSAVGQTVTLECPCQVTTTTAPVGTTSTTNTTLPDIDTRTFPQACVTLQLRRAFNPPETVRAAGLVEIAIDHRNVADRDGNGREEVPIQVYFLSFAVSAPTIGDVAVSLVDPSIHPALAMTSDGLLEEDANTTPGALDVPPYVAGGAGAMTLNLFLQGIVAGELLTGRAHNDWPVILAGPATGATPAPGDVLTMQNDADIPLLRDGDGLFFNVWIDSDESATLELNPQSCE